MASYGSQNLAATDYILARLEDLGRVADRPQGVVFARLSLDALRYWFWQKSAVQGDAFADLSHLQSLFSQAGGFGCLMDPVAGQYRRFVPHSKTRCNTAPHFPV